MKKNVLKGGIMSLIPKRDVKDADDVLDRIEKEEAKEEVKEEVAVVEEPEVEEPEVEEPEVEEPEVEVAAPEKPLVTPLTIEVDEDEDDGEEEPTGEKKKLTSPRLHGAEKKEVVAKLTKKVPAADVAMWDKHEGDVYHVAISDIEINPSQPRRAFEEVEMQELTDSIAQHGILQPLVVRRSNNGTYELVAGERRLRAAKNLKWERVPCVVRRDVRSGATSIELALIENIQREDLNPIEEALAYQQLNDEYGMTHEEIGQRVSRSRVGITNTIRMLQLPDEVQRGLVDGTISSGHARAILMIPDEEKQKRFYRHLVAEGLTVRKAETRARRIQRTMNLDDPMRRKRRGRTAFEIEYSGKLEDRYGYDVKLRFNEDKNRFEIMFKCHSKHDINELLGRLMGVKPLPEKVDSDVIEDEKED